jgi:hypothetical protein
MDHQDGPMYSSACGGTLSNYALQVMVLLVSALPCFHQQQTLILVYILAIMSEL